MGTKGKFKFLNGKNCVVKENKIMTKRTFITDYERESCRKVADAFAELYEQVNIVVKDAGKYGFVKLYCYEPYCGFCKMTTFIDSNNLFHDLWEEW